MSDKTYVLSLSADTFNAFKMDFDSALQRLLQKSFLRNLFQVQNRSY